MFNQLEVMYSSFIEVYGMLSKNEEYLEKVRLQNERYGVYRSGEGTPSEILERQKELEEQEYLNILYENNEYTYDNVLNEKLYKLFENDFKRRVARNDDTDLIRHHTFLASKPAPFISESEARAPRNLQALEDNDD
jgi:hypothetical protein